MAVYKRVLLKLSGEALKTGSDLLGSRGKAPWVSPFP